MKLERIILQNFMCFGPNPETIWFDPDITVMIGANGSGKTAAMLALCRMFGTGASRTITRQDFHVPSPTSNERPSTRTFAIDYVFSFPSLNIDQSEDPSVPSVFHQMTADENGQLKCRLRLEANWTDDGSAEGVIDYTTTAVTTMEPTFSENETHKLKLADLTRIRMIYIPALRDGASQMANFLRGPLWRSIHWSSGFRDVVTTAGTQLNAAFTAERGIEKIAALTTRHWRELHSAGTYATPRLVPIDIRFSEFVRKVSILFHPDHEGTERSVGDLSDGQRSLFHLSMVTSMLELESAILRDGDKSFDVESLAFPALTILGVEEPENNLAPFFLSRIVKQIQQITSNSQAQAIVASHSASILARIDPTQIRYFRTDADEHVSCVRDIPLPPDTDEASKYVREAVRAHPEVYFASFVILGEGASEEVAIPMLAESLDIPIDRSFVAIAPLGGRHVQYFWKLLNALEIPHATLLDLDLGRSGGGWGRVKTVCDELMANGAKPIDLVSAASTEAEAQKVIADLADQPLNLAAIHEWCMRLREFGVYFCEPLDLDLLLLTAYPTEYRHLQAGQRGPANTGDLMTAVLGPDGDATPYEGAQEVFKWYRYLFLGRRGKPHTHFVALASATKEQLAESVPSVLSELLASAAQLISNSGSGRQTPAASVDQ